jgi:hypothetical protein
LWDPKKDDNGSTRSHHALGIIRYPGDDQPAYVLYLKSSVNGDEPADVAGYARENKTFPHESTADQNFDLSQFEAYRELGKHIAESALKEVGLTKRDLDGGPVEFADLIACLKKASSDQT